MNIFIYFHPTYYNLLSKMITKYIYSLSWVACKINPTFRKNIFQFFPFSCSSQWMSYIKKLLFYSANIICLNRCCWLMLNNKGYHVIWCNDLYALASLFLPLFLSIDRRNMKHRDQKKVMEWPIMTIIIDLQDKEESSI